MSEVRARQSASVRAGEGVTRIGGSEANASRDAVARLRSGVHVAEPKANPDLFCEPPRRWQEHFVLSRQQHDDIALLENVVSGALKRTVERKNASMRAKRDMKS
jgi:hypothetical protein